MHIILHNCIGKKTNNFAYEILNNKLVSASPYISILSDYENETEFLGVNRKALSFEFLPGSSRLVKNSTSAVIGNNTLETGQIKGLGIFDSENSGMLLYKIDITNKNLFLLSEGFFIDIGTLTIGE